MSGIGYIPDEPIRLKVYEEPIPAYPDWFLRLCKAGAWILGPLVVLLVLCSIVRADGRTFAWAAQHVPCEQQGQSKTFIWAAQNKCQCGEGCPCCSKEGGCKCKEHECSQDANYNRLREKAIKEKLTLIVSVGCQERKIPFCLSCSVDSFEGIKPGSIAVCKEVDGKFVRTYVFKLPVLDATLIQASQCPDGKCPLLRSAQ